MVLETAEPNVRKRESAIERGLNVELVDIEQHTDTYDAISLLNVYSHLPNPQEFIEMAKNLLKPGGQLLIQTGDIAHFTASTIYKPLSLPDHLSFASQKIVVSILERVGFQIIGVKKYGLIKNDLYRLAREVMKVILPGQKSRFISTLLRFNNYALEDMYIFARIK